MSDVLQLVKPNLEVTDSVLETAKGILREVLVIGRNVDGSFFMSSSSQSARNDLWLLMTAQQALLVGAQNDYR